MAEFKNGDLVYAPNPDGDGEVPATFLEIAPPDYGLDVEAPGGGTRKADAAYVEWEDGTVGPAVYAMLRAVPADDPLALLRRFDGALLATLEGSGSVTREDFLKQATESGDDLDWPIPANEFEAQRWLHDAAQRGIVKIDEGWVTITYEGRNRLHHFL